jgi:hypothetical protein
VNKHGLSLLELLVGAVGLSLLIGIAASLQFQAQRRFQGIESSLSSIGDLPNIQRRIDQDLSAATSFIEFPNANQMIVRGRAQDNNGDSFDSTVTWLIENDVGPQCTPGFPCVRLVRRQAYSGPGVVPFQSPEIRYSGLIAVRWCSEFAFGAGVPPMAGCLNVVRPPGSRKVLFVQIDYLNNLRIRQSFPMALALRNLSLCPNPTLMSPIFVDEVRR